MLLPKSKKICCEETAVADRLQTSEALGQFAVCQDQGVGIRTAVDGQRVAEGNRQAVVDDFARENQLPVFELPGLKDGVGKIGGVGRTVRFEGHDASPAPLFGDENPVAGQIRYG